MTVQVGSSPHPRDRIRDLVDNHGFNQYCIMKEGLTEEDAREVAESLARVLCCDVHHGASFSEPLMGWAVFVVSDAT